MPPHDPMIGDQTLHERSDAILEGGPEWPAGNLTGVLQSGGQSTSTPVLSQMKGDNLQTMIQNHWPLLLLILVVAYCVWHYKFRGQ